MAAKCFNLKDVPDDEAMDIREILRQNDIDFYETPAGKWGISMPAIWLNKSSQLNDALLLIHSYQQKRQQNAREQLDNARKHGENPSFFNRLKQNPVTFISIIAFIGLILYLSIKPFLSLGI